MQRTPPQQPLEEASLDEAEREWPTTLADAMQQVAEALNEVSTIMGGQRYINSAMRDKFAYLMELHKAALSFCNLEKINGEAQTTPSLAMGQGGSMADKIALNAGSNLGGQKATPKRPRDQTLAQRNTPPKKSRMRANAMLQSKMAGEESSQNTAPQTKEAWNKVASRHNRVRKAKPDAILVQGVGECTYADLLKAVKTHPSLRDMSNDVQGIRKTENGSLLLRLSKASAHGAQELQLAVKNALGDRAAVKRLTELSQLEIRDLDELTTKEEICEALNSKNTNIMLAPEDVKSIRKSFGGTQIATLCVAANKASSILELEKVRIGWVVCRIRSIFEPKRCFRSATWSVSEIYTASDHRAIVFNFGGRNSAHSNMPTRTHYKSATLDVDAFQLAIGNMSVSGNAETMAQQAAQALQHACGVSMQRSGSYRRHNAVYWWTDQIAKARAECLKARRAYCRARGTEAHASLRLQYCDKRRLLKRAIKDQKRLCFLRMCEEADHDPWGQAYKVRAIQSGAQCAASPRSLERGFAGWSGSETVSKLKRRDKPCRSCEAVLPGGPAGKASSCSLHSLSLC
ncbi:hypothetical protein ACLKA7_007752 [Drosophila subpalustris]